MTKCLYQRQRTRRQPPYETRSLYGYTLRRSSSPSTRPTAMRFLKDIAKFRGLCASSDRAMKVTAAFGERLRVARMVNHDLVAELTSALGQCVGHETRSVD